MDGDLGPMVSVSKMKCFLLWLREKVCLVDRYDNINYDINKRQKESLTNLHEVYILVLILNLCKIRVIGGVVKCQRYQVLLSSEYFPVPIKNT